MKYQTLRILLIFFLKKYTKNSLSKKEGEIAGIIREMLNTATVNFGGNNNEISENGLGGESNKKRSADEKKKDDNKE